MNPMKKLIVANWKMNPQTEQQAIRLARAEDQKGVVICPPFPFLDGVKGKLKKADLGAQDLFWEDPPTGGGPYTGEVSVLMLKRLGARYVIIGHSERRRWLGETDEMINRKVVSAARGGLKVILCVGEPLSVRKKGLYAAKQFVKSQLRKNLKSVRSPVIIAYEPIWAIGTGKPDRPEDTLTMVRFIKGVAGSSCRVLYGGSVTSQNVKSFLCYKEMYGALVGGASLKAQEFRKIITIVKKL